VFAAIQRLAAARRSLLARPGRPYDPVHVHSSAGRLDIRGGRIELPPWSFIWIAGI